MNAVRLTSPSTNSHATSNKQVDSVALLLKQTIAPAQLTQVSYDDEDEREKNIRSVYRLSLPCFSFLFTKVR